MKATALLQSIYLNHPFTDGNKRTAWAAIHRLLWINGYHLKAAKTAVVEFMLYVDNSQPKVEEIASWLKTRSRKRKIK